MEIKDQNLVPAFESDHGETVWELIGNVASNTKAEHSLAICQIAPGKASRKHYHPICEESYYLLSGEAKMVIDDKEENLKAGMSVLISPKQVHQIHNTGTSELKFVAVCIPPWDPECSVFLDEN